jgi:iron complex outermembrane receptor protein
MESMMRYLNDLKIGVAVILVGVSEIGSAQNQASNSSMEIVVSGQSEIGKSILSPSHILSSDELQVKTKSSLGETLANELGVSSSGFSTGSSRPVIRGLSDQRVQILQNGLSVNDLSSLSNDHGVASSLQNASQIQILRGAAALMYGSGSSGGLVNIVNDRIPTALPEQATGEFNTSYESNNQGKTGSAMLETSSGPLAFHIDTSVRNANDYKIPGYRKSGDNSTSSGKLPYTFHYQNNLGLGASYIGKSGYTGVSVERLNSQYGVPSENGSSIEMSQNRYDLQHQTRSPLSGFSELNLGISRNAYTHTEFESSGTAASLWKNDGLDFRATMEHLPLKGFKGLFGIQSSQNKLSATAVETNQSAIVPKTSTTSNSLFWVEEGVLGQFRNSLGARYNLVAQNPDATSRFSTDGNIATALPSLSAKNFNLLSYAVGSKWEFMPNYDLGLSYTHSERAPNAPELYAYGAHEATAQFIIGNPNLQKEKSNNFELNLQKKMGLVQGRMNLYLNRFTNFIYGSSTGESSGDGDSVYLSSQKDAQIKGAEAEVTHNWKKTGIGSRIFGDISQGTFTSGGNLPLQPPPRIGVELAHIKNQWSMNTTLIHAYEQSKLASFETTKSPSYNLLNASVSYTEKMDQMKVTAYLRLTNLLNQEIRYSTTPETVRLWAPQMGRSMMVGVRGAF